MMNKWSSWKFLLLVCCLVGCSTIAAAQAPRLQRLDGEYWIQASATVGEIGAAAKLMFAAGLLTGLRTAPALIVTTDESGSSLNAIQAYLEKHLRTMPSQQLVAGLDLFYADYANRRIMVSDAAAVVLRRIVGDDEAQIETWVRSLRDRASKGH